MLIARRLYVYFIAAVSLGMTVVGLANLLGLAFARMSEALGGSAIQRSPESVRQELSLYAALVIVAFPVWLLHWFLAERAVRRPGAEGEHERASSIRALYLTLALAVPLLSLVISAVGVLRWLFIRLFGGTTTLGNVDEHWTSLALLLVSGSVIAYHGGIRLRDIRGGRLEGAGAWLPRLYVYVAAFIGAMLLLFGLADLIRLLNDVLFGVRAVFNERRWWAEPLSSAIARVLVGLAVWGLFWDLSLRTLRRPDWLGLSERRSSLRWLYIYAIVFIGVLFTLRGISSSLNEFLRLILDVPRNAIQPSWARAILEPLIVAIPFAGFWAYHRLVVLEAMPAEKPAPLADSFRRVYTYLVALIGLAFTGAGTAYVLGILIDLLLRGSRTVSVSSTFWRDDVARFSAFALVGASAWLWHWSSAERRVAEDEAVERGATTRRVYLYLTLAVTLVAILVSLAIVVYRIISAVLGVEGGSGFVSSISTELGIVAVAGALFVYHLVVMRQDLAQRAEESAAGVEAVPLTLIAPPGADLDAMLTELRAHLPEGYALERERPAGHLSDLLTSEGPERDET